MLLARSLFRTTTTTAAFIFPSRFMHNNIRTMSAKEFVDVRLSACLVLLQALAD